MLRIGVKSLLLNPQSKLWNPANKSAGLKALATAAQEPAVQKNALDFLDLIRKCSNEGSYEMRSEEASAIFQSPDLIKAIWDAAITTPLQFRRLQETRGVRDYLIQKGIDEKLLATPNWLMVNIDKDVKKKAAYKLRLGAQTGAY